LPLANEMQQQIERTVKDVDGDAQGMRGLCRF